jgi:SAM-dependent methyltransferase
MEVKRLLRPIPGVQQGSRVRQRLAYRGSASFWERRYANGGLSGPGSYGELARGKAMFLNTFVQGHGIGSVIEFGCGDGNQLSLASYPRYVGLDVSKSAVELCVRRFANDRTKSFFLYDGQCFVDREGLFSADLALSLDVIYHLTEDSVFETYMNHLFNAGRQYVIVYSTNGAISDGAPHVIHRKFSTWVDRNCPRWQVESMSEGPDAGPRRADFYVYKRNSCVAQEAI